MAWATTSFRSRAGRARQMPQRPPGADPELPCESGPHRYAIDISCSATTLPPEDPTPERHPAVPQVEAKFLRLRNPAKLGRSDRGLARVLAR